MVTFYFLDLDPLKKLFFSTLKLSAFKIYSRTYQQQTKRALDETGRTNLMRKIFYNIRIKFLYLHRTPWSCEFCELWIAPVILNKEQKEHTFKFPPTKNSKPRKISLHNNFILSKAQIHHLFPPQTKQGSSVLAKTFLLHDLHRPT